MKHNPTGSSNRLSFWLFIYAVSYTVFHITPVFLNVEIKYQFMLGDLFDLLTPFIIIFLVYKLYRIVIRSAGEHTNSRTAAIAVIILILGGIAFVEGHGMHLSANALARHLTSESGSPLFILDYFFDEILGHIFWDSGILFLSLGLILIGYRMNQKQELAMNLTLIIIASLMYGFTYFVNAIEGQTVEFTLPLSLIIPLSIWWFAHRGEVALISNPVLAFFLLSYSIALCLFVSWYIWQGGFPEFSKLGWI